MPFNETDTLAINAIRALSIDMIEKANSGHPGLPLGLAPAAYAVWSRHLTHNPANPSWVNRDRFVLSGGHGSSMLYALLHLFGYGLPLEELKNFRQLGSRTPGHPEHGLTKGVETTTGPLAQGFANAVGMAFAEKYLAGLFNTPEFPVIDHYTYVLCGDGDLMEGLSYEAASLAGHWKLGKLVCVYDSNDITIEGPTALAFTEDVKKRFQAQDWQVIEVEDGNDLSALDLALKKARREAEKPSLVIAKTHIGYCSPKQGKCSVHGEPLKKDEVLATKKSLGWPYEEPFRLPEELGPHFEALARSGERAEKKWLKLLKAYRARKPELAAKLGVFLSGELPEELVKDADLAFDKPLATREASHRILNLLADRVENLIGGSADLAPSTKTDLVKHPERTLHFGVREHAMGAVLNGMALHGGLRPFGSTFLVFTDYMRGAMRLAALMRAHALFVFSHDSVGVGEDGPTHQPVEHIMALRLIPGLDVWRPADAVETFYAWEAALRNGGPAALLFSRQKLPILVDQKDKIKEGVKRGAYTLKGPAFTPDVELIATGSEVALALETSAKLDAAGIRTKVISMPCYEAFLRQDESYRASVITPNLPKVAIEAGRGLGWKDIAGGKTLTISIDTFGVSAPFDKAFAHLGFTPDAVAEKAKAFLGKK